MIAKAMMTSNLVALIFLWLVFILFNCRMVHQCIILG